MSARSFTVPYEQSRQGLHVLAACAGMAKGDGRLPCPRMNTERSGRPVGEAATIQDHDQEGVEDRRIGVQ